MNNRKIFLLIGCEFDKNKNQFKEKTNKTREREMEEIYREGEIVGQLGSIGLT